MAEEASARRWITCTVLGCGGLILLALLLAGGFLGHAWLDVRNQQRVERSLQPALPVADDGDRSQGATGRVEIELTGADVNVRAARRGEALRVEASFDERIYRLEEHLHTDDVPWTYRLALSGDVAPIKTLLRGIVGGQGAKVEIFLPTDVPLELSIGGTQSAFTIDLADLWITDAELEFSQGGVFLEASGPTAQPVGILKLDGSMGGFRLMRLGNASPGRLVVDARMSGLEVDLLGEWRNDSSITLRSNSGGGTLRLPSGVNLVGIASGPPQPPISPETPRPTLTFTVAANEFRVVE